MSAGGNKYVTVASGKDGGAVQCCFYGWIIVFTCILCKIFKVQGENKVMTYTVPHLMEEFQFSHAHLGGFFSAATIMAGTAQPMLGKAVDYFGGRICISLLQLAIGVSLAVFAHWYCAENRPLLRMEAVSVFFLLRILCLGAGETFPNALVQQWFHKKRGRAIGVIFTTQWLGQALFGTFIAGIVDRYGWREAAMLGAAVNLALAPVSLLLLRRSPEVCGLMPDGSTPKDSAIVIVAEEAPETKDNLKEEETPTDLRKFWAHFGLTFFYAMMFGGSDFYMVEIIEEASPMPEVSAVSVPWHIFTPLAVVTSIALPAVGELMDAHSSHSKWLPPSLLALACILGSIATLMLSSIRSWFAAVCYGVLRGISTGILQTLLLAGLCFSAQGVSRAEIGRILGSNLLCNLVGTGSAPFLFGICRDLFGSFGVSLCVPSVPMLFLAVYFTHQALWFKTDGSAVQGLVV
ncbi:ybfB [Symbiodinium sp. CCMP2456]|nr:ybfB [Symbiodinium sp. CCMP2456]